MYLFEEEKSENTIQKYVRDVCAFYENVGNKELKKSEVIEYKKMLIKKYAPRSVNSVLSALNAFFEYIKRYDLKVKTLKIQRRIFAEKEKELTKSEYERLLNAAKRRKNKRLYYLMQTMVTTGVRVSEIKYITCDALKKGRATIDCKGKIRYVFLAKKLCEMLSDYIRKEKITKGSVFVTKTGKPLDRSNIWKMMNALCAEAGVDKKKVFPHNLRHLFARTFYKMKKDIVRLADILGHSSVNTTRIYTMETGEEHIRSIQELGLLLC